MTDCLAEHVGLALLSLALLISLCLNLIFCVRRRDNMCRDTEECCYPRVYDGDRPSQAEGCYFPNLNHDTQEENPHSHHEQQENPIYGNISTDRRGSAGGCYETMTMQHTRDRMQSLEPDVNYASLDLKVAKKYKKKHRQGRNKAQDQPPVQLTPPANAFLEVEADMEARLPPRDTSTMVSHSSIYLNSQQIAQETEELERENGSWEGTGRQELGGSEEWEGEREGEERNSRKYYSNGSVCTQLSEVEDIQSGADRVSSSFSHDGVQQE